MRGRHAYALHMPHGLPYHVKDLNAAVVGRQGKSLMGTIQFTLDYRAAVEVFEVLL